jgi:hypothetical protein
MRVYRLRNTVLTVRWRLIEPVCFALVGLAFLVPTLSPSIQHLSTRAFSLAVALSAFYLCAKSCAIPRAVKVADDGTFTFESFAGRQKVPPGSVASFLPHKQQMRTFVVSYSQGRIVLPCQFDDWPSLVADLRRFNPTAKVDA